MLSRESVGWQEKSFASAITSGTAQKILDNKVDYQILIHRIRGSSTQNILIKTGTAAVGSTTIETAKAADAIDIPGLYTAVPLGHNVYIDADANVTPDIRVQYSYVRVS